MALTIKPFTGCSPTELYSLFKDVYSSSDGMSETLDEKYPDLAAFEKDMTTLSSRPGTIALAAVLAGKPLAYVVIRPRHQSRLRHTADLNMGVASEARGQGLGEKILRAGLDCASTAGAIEIIYLMVRADNASAIQLYQKTEFETVAILPRDTKIGDFYADGILMRKFLKS